MGKKRNFAGAIKGHAASPVSNGESKCVQIEEDMEALMRRNDYLQRKIDTIPWALRGLLFDESPLTAECLKQAALELRIKLAEVQVRLDHI